MTDPCIQVTRSPHGPLVIRALTQPDVRLIVTPDEFATFLAEAKAGVFDHLLPPATQPTQEGEPR